MKRTIFTLFALGAVLLFGAGCYNTSTTTNSNTTSTASGQNTVSISGMAFSPITLTVTKGTTVTWTNNDSVSHTVTGDNGGPASGSLKQGGTYTYAYTTVGTFPYHCAIHPSMTATVVVTE